MRVCPVCGATYSAAHEFCPMDGSPLRDNDAPSTVMTIPGRQVDSGSPRSEAMVGRVLDDRYRLDELIGAGGMGVVYRATHVVIGKPMAIKVLREGAARNPEVVQRFLLEAQLASSLEHENVVDISDYGQLPEGTAYYVMEYLPGHSLADEIDHHGKLDPARALEIAVQIGRGLAAAHAHNIVHRDLKPDNVYLCPTSDEGRDLVKLLDFGIARVEGRKTRLTAIGAVVGTPEYMSPEQAQGSEVDHRTDLYALGTILFEMLTGKVPFRGDTALGTLTKQMFDPPPKLREVDPGLSHMPRIEAAIGKLLSKHRDERPTSAEDAIRQLQDAYGADLHGAVAAPRGKATVALGSDALAEPPDLPHTVGAPGAAVAPAPVATFGGRGDSPSVVMRRGGEGTHITAELDGVGGGRQGLANPPVTLLVVGTAMFAGLITAGVIVRLNRGAAEPSKAPVEAPTQVAAVQPEPERVTLRFLSTPAGAEVLEGGKTLLGVTPFSQDVDRAPRTSSYLFRLSGHSEVVRQVALDRDRSLAVELVALPPARTAEDDGAEEGAKPAAPRKRARRRPRPKKPARESRPKGGESAPTGAPAEAERPPVDPPSPRPLPRPMTRGDLKDPFGPK